MTLGKTRKPWISNIGGQHLLYKEGYWRDFFASLSNWWVERVGWTVSLWEAACKPHCCCLASSCREGRHSSVEAHITNWGAICALELGAPRELGLQWREQRLGDWLHSFPSPIRIGTDLMNLTDSTKYTKRRFETPERMDIGTVIGRKQGLAPTPWLSICKIRFPDVWKPKQSKNLKPFKAGESFFFFF